MNKLKLTIIGLLAFVLLVPTWLAIADTDQNEQSKSLLTSAERGELAKKDEVVYAKLSATGDQDEVYVVNVLDIVKAGKVTDFGHYTDLKNLTDLSPIEQQEDGEITLVAPEGLFYYQGDLDETELPWNISISYSLNGEEIAPEALAGQDGQVQIRISTAANDEANSTYYDHYLLQISLALDLTRFTNIDAPDATLAYTGQNQQITFTVLPESEADLLITADVEEFELDGIEIAALPASMPGELPDMDDMLQDMDQLPNAVSDVHNGVSELLNGLIKINEGTSELERGSEQYYSGISALDASADELVSGSAQLANALTTLNQSLDTGSEDTDLGDLTELEQGLRQLAQALQQVPDGMGSLQEHFSTAYDALDLSMSEIPEHDISETQIEQLLQSEADPEVLTQLLETYAAARTAKGTYEAAKEAFEAVDPTLEQISSSLHEMSSQVSTMASGVAEALEDSNSNSFADLQAGIAALAEQYTQFHGGLTEFTGGVSQLASTYGDLHLGFEELSTGTAQLEVGTEQLHEGTAELTSATQDLPEQMRQEADQILADYDSSDFEVTSFVSPHNKEIHSVQFVMRTGSIKLEQPEPLTPVVEEKESFWTRFINLFK